MKRIVHSLFFGQVMIAGLFIGMVKGQEVRNKWITKMKSRHEERKPGQHREVILDEIEMATYHS